MPKHFSCLFMSSSMLSVFHFTAGRISFYDQYGVIRDVIQNHLTEVMTLLTMSVPKNLTDCKEINRNKLKVFSALHQLDMPSAVLGQYQTYNSEVQLELNKTKDHFSLSPTYAGRLADQLPKCCV